MPLPPLRRLEMLKRRSLLYSIRSRTHGILTTGVTFLRLSLFFLKVVAFIYFLESSSNYGLKGPLSGQIGVPATVPKHLTTMPRPSGGCDASFTQNFRWVIIRCGYFPVLSCLSKTSVHHRQSRVAPNVYLHHE
jgi:hypothetical protein